MNANLNETFICSIRKRSDAHRVGILDRLASQLKFTKFLLEFYLIYSKGFFHPSFLNTTRPLWRGDKSLMHLSLQMSFISNGRGRTKKALWSNRTLRRLSISLIGPSLIQFLRLEALEIFGENGSWAVHLNLLIIIKGCPHGTICATRGTHMTFPSLFALFLAKEAMLFDSWKEVEGCGTSISVRTLTSWKFVNGLIYLMW